MITWLLLVYGLTLILTESKLLEPVRTALGWCFLSCSMCMGWWVGLGIAMLGWPMPGLPVMEQLPLPVWVYFLHAVATATESAFASSGWCWMVHVVLEKLGASEL